MTTVFLICATVGGTILLCQLVLTLLGLAGDSFDGDVGHDVGGDFHGDVGGDFDGDVGGDFDGDMSGDFHGDTGGDLHADAVTDVEHGDHAAGHHGSSWLFGVLSFRSIVAALTFFGLAGMAAQSGGAETPIVLLIALGAGAAALYGVYWLMRGLYGLKADGTVRVRRAVGRLGTVYLKIPPHDSGTGKIQINLQNRTVELLAMTQGEMIPAGAKVVVVDLLTPNTVAVEPALETEHEQPERIEHA